MENEFGRPSPLRARRSGRTPSRRTAAPDKSRAEKPRTPRAPAAAPSWAAAGKHVRWWLRCACSADGDTGAAHDALRHVVDHEREEEEHDAHHEQRATMNAADRNLAHFLRDDAGHRVHR